MNKIALLLVFIGSANFLMAQSTPNNNSDKANSKNATSATLEPNLEMPLPPLDTLIAWALIKNASLKVQDAQIAIRQQEYEIKKREWRDLLSINGTTAYGNNQLYDVQQSQQGITPIVTTRQSIIYNFGIATRLSLGDIMNRNKKIALKRLEVEKTAAEKEVLKDQIREEVITRYYKLLIALKMLKLEADNLETKKMGLEVAEKYFREGNLAVTEYSVLLNTKIAIEKQYEQAKFDVQYALKMLREFVGF
jgi:outer membrane protein TolC